MWPSHKLALSTVIYLLTKSYSLLKVSLDDPALSFHETTVCAPFLPAKSHSAI